MKTHNYTRRKLPKVILKPSEQLGGNRPAWRREWRRAWAVYAFKGGRKTLRRLWKLQKGYYKP